MALSTRKKSFGGLKVRNINKIDSKFICESCKLVLLYPHQLLCCGTLHCRWCLLNGLSNNEPFICPLCYVKQVKKEGMADRGVEGEMKKITVACYSCSWEGLYSNYLNHLQEQHADLECLDCHQRFFAINSLEEHRQELCVERSIPCELPDCANSVKWYDMKSHYLSNHHQQKLLIIVSENAHPRRRRRIQNQNSIQEYQNIQESIAIVFLTHEILLNDSMRLTLEISQMETNFRPNLLKIEELKRLEKENEKNTKELIEKQNGIPIEMDRIKKTREERSMQILDANSTTILRLIYPTTTPFSINSLKFKTSQYGWIFMLRACSTVVDNDEYLSFFLSLYNGEYYNLIPFPFSYPIHIILWDQSNRQNHIVNVLKPDPTSSAVNRPINEKNDEYGIAKYCLLRSLTDPESDYVKDGVFFVRIFIDFLNIGHNPFQLTDNNQDTGMITD